MARVGVTTYNSSSKESTPEPSNPLLAFVNRTGSGFFSSLSALPSIFSLSSPPPPSPTESPPPHRDETNPYADVNDSAPPPLDHERSATPFPTSPLEHSSSSHLQDISVPPKKAPPISDIKMGIVRTSSGIVISNGRDRESANEEPNNTLDISEFHNMPSEDSSQMNKKRDFIITDVAAAGSGTGTGGVGVGSGGVGGDVGGGIGGGVGSVGASGGSGSDASTSIDVQLFLKLNSYLMLLLVVKKRGVRLRKGR